MSRGLHKKYVVLKDGQPVEERCFVLKPESDPAALEALETYARATASIKLCADLLRWIDAINRQRTE